MNLLFLKIKNVEIKLFEIYPVVNTISNLLSGKKNN